MKTMITYGTFDLLHVSNVNILARLSKLGNKLIVGVSTDEFNLLKGKHSVHSYAERAKIVQALGCVEQAITDLKKALSKIDSAAIQQIKTGLDSVLDLVRPIE